MASLDKILLLLLVVYSGAASAQTSVWPEIQSLQEQRTFVRSWKDSSDTPLNLFIKALNGVSIYKLECHNGEYDDTSRFNFSGTFHCFFFALREGAPASGNLLATDDPAERSSDWFNRGRMISNALWGECADNPDYGRVRRFRLRGMQITFEFSNLSWFAEVEDSLHRLSRFTFSVSVASDKTAQTETAEKVATPRPGPPCYW